MFRGDRSKREANPEKGLRQPLRPQSKGDNSTSTSDDASHKDKTTVSLEKNSSSWDTTWTAFTKTKDTIIHGDTSISLQKIFIAMDHVASQFTPATKFPSDTKFFEEISKEVQPIMQWTEKQKKSLAYIGKRKEDYDALINKINDAKKIADEFKGSYRDYRKLNETYSDIKILSNKEDFDDDKRGALYRYFRKIGDFLEVARLLRQNVENSPDEPHEKLKTALSTVDTSIHEEKYGDSIDKQYLLNVKNKVDDYVKYPYSSKYNMEEFDTIQRKIHHIMNWTRFNYEKYGDTADHLNYIEIHRKFIESKGRVDRAIKIFETCKSEQDVEQKATWNQEYKERYARSKYELKESLRVHYSNAKIFLQQANRCLKLP